MVEKFNCKGMYDCEIDCHWIMVKYADYLALENLLRAAHEELTNAGHQELSECDCKIASALNRSSVK
jgi:hypothetical protein